MKHYLGLSVLVAVAATATILMVRTCSDATTRTIDQVKDAFNSVLHVQPQVTVNSRVVLTQTAPIAELAVVSKQELVSLGFDQHLAFLSYQIPLTEKTLKAEATYEIKAGFDLKQPINVTIDPLTHRIHATLPHATILSVEQIGNLSLDDQDATLNRVADAERAKLVNDLLATARDQAEKSSLRTDADHQITTRLQEIFSHNGQTFEADWNADTPAPLPQP